MQVNAADFRGLVRWFQVSAGGCRWLQVNSTFIHYDKISQKLCLSTVGHLKPARILECCGALSTFSY